MNRVSVTVGALLIGIGLIASVARLRAPQAAQTIATMKASGPQQQPAIARFVRTLMVPIVLPLAIGLSFLVLGLMGRPLAPFSWFGW